MKKNKKSGTKKTLTDKVKKDPTLKTNTSLRLEKSVLKQLKIRAIENDTSVQQILESLVTGYLSDAK